MTGPIVIKPSALTGLKRGARGRCPACGIGRLFNAYLKIRPVCATCGHDNGQYPADNAPPYFTILIVGHVLGPGHIYAFVTWRPDPLTLFAAFAVAAVAASLFLLPRLKGALVGLQWARRMHGFGAAGD